MRLNAATGNATLFGSGGVPATKPGTKPGTSDEIDWNPATNNLRVTGAAQAAHRNRACTSSKGVSAARSLTFDIERLLIRR